MPKSRQPKKSTAKLIASRDKLATLLKELYGASGYGKLGKDRFWRFAVGIGKESSWCAFR